MHAYIQHKTKSQKYSYDRILSSVKWVCHSILIRDGLEHEQWNSKNKCRWSDS